jgi:cation:H+ antiporter
MLGSVAISGKSFFDAQQYRFRYPGFPLEMEGMMRARQTVPSSALDGIPLEIRTEPTPQSRVSGAYPAREAALDHDRRLLLASAALIYFACEFFVNGIEWVGERFGVSKTAVGTVLAAFGTALPESVVTLVAVAFGETPAQRDIGVGAALGGPLVLATIAYAVVGVVFLLDPRHRGGRIAEEFSTRRLARDQVWFLAIFVFKVAVGVVAFAWKPWLGVVFLLAYVAYVWRELSGEGHADDEHGEKQEPLRFRPHDEHPAAGWAVLQTLVALAVIFAGSQVFVHQLDAMGPLLGLSPQLVALLLSPIATELPETLNAVIWVRQGKTSLALGNISGAMMIQATVPSALGLFFTPWLLDSSLLWAAAVTMMAIAVTLVLLHRHALTARRLAALAGLYGVFAAGVLMRFH